MAKRKVIEDSDDEDNVESTPPRTKAKPSEIDVHDSIGDENQAQSHDVPQSANPSEGSTGLHYGVLFADMNANESVCAEQLNHDIRAAHRSLINPSLEGSNPSSNTSSNSQRQSQASSTMSRSKLTRAKTGIEKPRTKKALRKYGTENGRDIFDFLGDSDEEMEGSMSRNSVPTTIAGTWTTSSGDTAASNLPDQFQTDRTRGIPGLSSMPLPASKSTSIEQTQMSGSDTVATSPHTKAGIGPEQTQAGAKWFATSTYNNSEALTRPMSTSQEEVKYLNVSHSVPDLQKPAMLNNEVSGSKNFEPNSSASAFSPTRTITVESRANHGGSSAVHRDVDCDTSLWKFEEIYEPELSKPVVLVPDISQNCDIGAELSLPIHGPETWSINQTTLSKAKREKKDSDAVHIEEPGSDDLGIGLLKDQYQPRPSRSRSGNGNGEIIIPTDFSKRPESVLKRKETSSKRRKTSASHELVPNGETSDQIGMDQKDEPMGPVCSPQSQDETCNDRHMIQREDQNNSPAKLATDPLSQEKSSAKPTTKKPRGRPKKPTTSDITDAKPTDAVCSGSDLKRDDLEKAQPKNAKEGKKTKIAKKDPGGQTEATPLRTELVHDIDDEDDDDDDDDDNENEDPVETDQTKRRQGQVLDKISGNSSLSKPTKNATASSSPIKSNSQTPRTPEKLAAPNQKGPDKHSPISSGKVAYRVGLSKRARIAPLLRMVRKV